MSPETSDITPEIEVILPPAAELRGLRLLLPRPFRESGIRALAHRAVAAGLNALVVRVYRRGSTLWPSEAAPHWGLPSLRRRAKGQDVLAMLSAACRKEGIHLIAWMDLLPAIDRARERWVMSPLALRHRKWRMRRFSGSAKISGVEAEQMFLCPSRREVRCLLGDLACEVAERYPIDALWLERLRFPIGAERPDTSLCHCDQCSQRVKAELDIDLSKMPLDAEHEDYIAWTEWRENLLTQSLEEIVSRVRHARPGMPIIGGVPAGWEPEAINRTGLSDWPAWVCSGLLDLACTVDHASPGAIETEQRAERLTNDFDAVDPFGRLAAMLPLDDLAEERPPLQHQMEALPLSGHVWDAYERLPTDEEWRRIAALYGETKAIVPELDPLNAMNSVVAETMGMTAMGSPLANFLDDLTAVCQRGFGAFSDKQMTSLLEDLEQFEDLGATGAIAVADSDRTARNLNWIQRQLHHLRERQLLTRAH